MRGIFDKNISICRVILLKTLIGLNAKIEKEETELEKNKINEKIIILQKALEIIPKNK